MQQYHRLLAGNSNVTPLADVRPGTLRWLCIQYFGSSEFRQLAPSTQHTRRLRLEHICREPINPNSANTFGDVPTTKITVEALRILRDRKESSPGTANMWIKDLRSLFKFGMTRHRRFVPANSAREVETFPESVEGYHTWTVEEIAQYQRRHPKGTKASLALALLLYTGTRRSDAVRLGPHLERLGGQLRYQPEKTKRSSGVWLEIPILPELRAELDHLGGPRPTYLVTELGNPFTPAGFGNWFRDRCNEAGLTHCSAHGLRKAGATLAAENGATDAQLNAIFGWTGARQAAHYRRSARQRVLAAQGVKLIRF